MQNRQAIISFAQGEKIKSGLIWCTQCVHILQNLPAQEQAGALQLVQALLAMILNEAQVSRQASGDAIWTEVEKCLNHARIMVDSGVPQESEHHMTQALTQVNRISQKAMTHLIENQLLT